MKRVIFIFALTLFVVMLFAKNYIPEQLII
jgi:hypothetical protein